MDKYLTEYQIQEKIFQGIGQIPLDHQRVLVIVPDPTRSIPLPLFFRCIVSSLENRASQVDFLIALGTHPALDQTQILNLFGLTAEEKSVRYARNNISNHEWNEPDQLAKVGEISGSEIDEISQGLLHDSVAVRINKKVLDYDHLLVVSPVFPHEIAGFSGGNKYFFPGISGPDMIDLSHWMGALLTTPEIIGIKDNPVRNLIDRAASLIPRPRSAVCCVTTTDGVLDIFCGEIGTAWSQAADLSSNVHIRRLEHSYHNVLSILPPMYTEIWTGSKGMYKVERIVEDGGEVILYAPHIHNFSLTHGHYIHQIGYHVKEYFQKQPGKFDHIPAAVRAHSTHLKGLGSYDPDTGIEIPRIKVTLCTGIPEEECRAVNLAYLDPGKIHIEEWLQKRDETTLVVLHAGELLYRLIK